MACKVALLALVCLFGSHLAAADTPHLVKDINAVSTALSSSPVALGRLGNAELFETDLTTRTFSGSALVKSDGTMAGTVTLKTFTKSRPVSPAVTVGTHTFFSVEDMGLGVNDAAQGPQLWVTDGTADGTRQISSFTPGIALQLLASYGNSLLLAHRNENLKYDLYLTDGTSTTLTPFGSATGYGGSSDSIDFAVVGTRIYFVADSDDGLYRPELWRSDGTAASTHKVTAVGALDTNVYVHGLRTLNDSVVFFSNTVTYGSELTRVDASDAVTVVDLAPGAASGSYGSNKNAVLNGYVYFSGSTDGTNYELWRSDGTLAGTQLVKEINPGPSPSFDISFNYIVPAGNRLVFPANDGGGVKLWGTDGTAIGTVPLTPVVSFRGDAFEYLDENGDSEKYEYIPANVGTAQTTIITDGTPDGTAIAPAKIDGNYAAILRGTGDATSEYISFLTENPTNAAQDYRVYKFVPPGQFIPLRTTTKPMGKGTFTHLNGQLLFDSFDDASGQELWGSDDSGTRLLVDFRPQSTTASSNAQWLTDWNGKLAFVANDGVHGVELWVSDGTAAGTRVLDINAGAASSAPTHLYVWNGALYFFAFDGTASRLMRLTAPDASPETLATASPPNSFATSSGPEQPQCGVPLPVQLGSKLLFSAKTAQAGTELWSTDGTAAGTAMLADINPNVYYMNNQPMGSQPCNFTVFKGRAYFTAITFAGDSPGTLWSTDGTAAGTTQFANLVGASGLIVYRNELYFYANDPTGTLGNQTWKTDGTGGGTHPLVTATSVSDKLAGIPLGISNDRLILLVSSSSIPITYSLWASDGTASGAVQLAQTSGGGVLARTDRLYFSHDTGGDEEPWVSDGTPAGTHRLADLDSSGSSHPLSYLNFNGVTMIVTEDTGGPHLWRTDGTATATVQVAKLPLDPLFPSFSYRVSGQNLFFIGTDSTTGSELYVLGNDAPTAIADSANAPNGQSATVNVLANDTDSDGSIVPASTRVVQAPAHGTTSVGSDGAITYFPAGGYSGTDSFTYIVADNQGNTSNAATVTVTVTAAPIPIDNVIVHPKSGGGGPLRWYDLLALVVLATWRFVRFSARSTTAWKNLSAPVHNL